MNRNTLIFGLVAVAVWFIFLRKKASTVNVPLPMDGAGPNAAGHLTTSIPVQVNLP